MALKRCTRCVMPETWPGITFDQEGVCSLCKAYDEEQKIDWEARKKELIGILNESYKQSIKAGSPYTAIAGYSGGKDTAWTIAYLAKELGVRILAFTYDHGHPLVPEGDWNLNEFPKVLGVDHLRFTLGNELRNAICRIGMEQIQDWCLPCHRGVGAGIVNMAKALNINLMIFGEPTALYSTTGTYKLSDREENDRRHFEDVFAGKLNIVPQGFTKRDTWMLDWPEDSSGLKSIYLGHFIGPWNQVEHVEYIKALGWKCPEATPENPWPWNKLDCEFEKNRQWSKILKLGFDHYSFRASIDIREGRMTRNSAIELVWRYQGQKPDNMADFLKDIDMTEDEFNELTLRGKHG